MRSISFFLLVFSSLAPVRAQADTMPASIGSPGLGFAYDAGLSAIRPIQGIPGAALLGAPLDLGFAISAAAISPEQDSALTVSLDDSQVRLVHFQAGTPTVIPVSGAMASPDFMVFSPGGRAALLYRRDSGRLQLLTGLSGAPAAQELTAPGPVRSPEGLALSDDAALILLVSGGLDSDPVWLLAADGTAAQLPLPGSSAAAAFLRNSHDALAVTRSGEIYLARNAGGGASSGLVRAGDDQTSDPVAVRFSADGAHAYAANTKGTVSVIDLQSGSSDMTSCQCSPAGLQPLKFGAYFRLNEISSRPLFLFDGSGTSPRVWFVPPDQAPADSPRSEQ
jgi:hypothetical protein